MSRSQEIIKIRAEINKIKSKKIQKINETKGFFSAKINKIDKTLIRFIKKKRDGTETKLEMKQEK